VKKLSELKVEAMRWGAFLIAGLGLAIACDTCTAGAPHSRLVYRVDRVSAAVVGNKLVVDVSGAVRSGGWHHPRLRPKASAPEAHVLEMEFYADPPPPKRVVIQELLPISTELKAGLPKYGTVAVSVSSETNEITTQIRVNAK
jgi:hypothetical protein